VSTAPGFVYLNGSFVPRDQAVMDVEDRGMMFADGVYEVLRAYNGRPLAEDLHLQRMTRSLRAIGLDSALVADLPAIGAELLQRNGWRDAAVYWQITRGGAPRHRAIPANVKPSILVMAWPAPALEGLRSLRALRLISVPDRRWHRCSIKSLMLLDNVLAKQAAAEQGGDDALYVRDGIVTESTATNVFIVREGALWTHPADDAILAGITRHLIFESARQQGLTVREAPFTQDEARRADEMFVTGTTTHVAAVTHVDGQPIGGGTAGEVTQRLHEALLAKIDAL